MKWNSRATNAHRRARFEFCLSPTLWLAADRCRRDMQEEKAMSVLPEIEADFLNCNIGVVCPFAIK